MLKELEGVQFASSVSRTPVSLTGFFLITFVVSWLGAIPMIVASWQPGPLPAGLGYLQLLLFFGTALSTILMVWWNEGRAGVTNLLQRLLIWRVGLRWVAFALFSPAIVFRSALQISQWLGSGVFPLRPPLAMLTSFGSILLGYLLLNTEELAWRGYALPYLLAKFSPWHASVILGIIWGIFHLPIFLMKGGHPAGYPLSGYLLMSVGLSVACSWLFLNTKASILLAHLFHQAINSWAETIPFFPTAIATRTPFLIVVAILMIGVLLAYLGWSSPKFKAPNFKKEL